MPSAAYAQTVTQYTINEGSGGGDDIGGEFIAATVCPAGNATGGTPLVKNFVVGDNFTVSDVDLGFFASHSYREDIGLILQSPAGTRVRIVNGTGSGAGLLNFNGLLDDDDLTNPIVYSGGHDTDSLTPVPNPPSQAYEEDLRPNNAFSAFDGQNSLGTWRLEICDMFTGADDGNFQRADLFLTDTPPNADLSLSKTVSNGSPTFGTNVTYTLTVNNASSSTATANSITVQDTLPTGVIYVSSSGTGTYDNTTGVWTVGSLAPNTSASMNIVVTVNATNGATVTNSAEISASSETDMDSTPNNSSTTEDDDDTASFTVAGTRVAGTPPTLVCPNGTTLFDWDSPSVVWTAGDVGDTFAVTNIGDVDIDISITQGVFLNNASVGGQSPAEQTLVNGGFTGESSLIQLADFQNNTTANATTVITLPTAVPGLQFTLTDVDFGAAQFADSMIVSGTFDGAGVMPTLTNNISNYVIGNTAFGDVPAASGTDDGNIVVTFSNPVDTITIVYTNYSAAPANPGQQGISIHDITYCRPVADISVTKLSSVVTDTISASNPKSIPGATVQYCILVTNAGSGTATDISLSDDLPADVTFITGSMFTGTNCGASATTAEDENASGTDEGNPGTVADPFGMSYDGAAGVTGSGVVSGFAGTLGPGDTMAMVFNATID